MQSTFLVGLVLYLPCLVAQAESRPLVLFPCLVVYIRAGLCLCSGAGTSLCLKCTFFLRAPSCHRPGALWRSDAFVQLRLPCFLCLASVVAISVNFEIYYVQFLESGLIGNFSPWLGSMSTTLPDWLFLNIQLKGLNSKILAGLSFEESRSVCSKFYSLILQFCLNFIVTSVLSALFGWIVCSCALVFLLFPSAQLILSGWLWFKALQLVSPLFSPGTEGGQGLWTTQGFHMFLNAAAHPPGGGIS